jgi:hypothetical protein
MWDLFERSDKCRINYIAGINYGIGVKSETDFAALNEQHGTMIKKIQASVLLIHFLLRIRQRRLEGM